MLMHVVIFLIVFAGGKCENLMFPNQDLVRGLVQINHLLSSLPKSQTFQIAEQCSIDKEILVETIKSNVISFQTIYDQCLDLLALKNVSFHGKYCQATLSIHWQYFSGTPKFSSKLFTSMLRKLENAEGLNLMFAVLVERLKFLNPNEPVVIQKLPLPICYPDSCSAKDIENDLAGNLNIFFPDNSLKLHVKDSHCVTTEDRKHLRPIDWIFISFLIVLGVLIIGSTSYDLYIVMISKVKPNRLLVVFSWYRHLNTFFNVAKYKRDYPVLDGLRTLSMIWIILAQHFKYFILTVPCINSQDFIQWTQSWPSQIIFGASFAVETMFFLGGFLVIHGFMKSRKENVPFNVLWFYLKRYLRLTPAFFGAIFFTVSVFRYLSDGPLWTTMMKSKITPCERYWWSSLLYIQNFWNPKKMCIEESWYLQVDMQLTLVAPFLFLAITYVPKFASKILAVLIGISTLIPLIIFWSLDLKMDITQFIPKYSTEIRQHYFYATWARAISWLMGGALAYYMFNKEKTTKLNQQFINIMWTIWTKALPALIISKIAFLQTDSTAGSFLSGFYCSYATVAWGVLIGWLVFACIEGHGWLINRILSLPPFQMLSRLTYSMYLIHPILLALKFGSVRTIQSFQPLIISFTFWGTLVYTIFLAFFGMLIFEMPIISFIKILNSSKSVGSEIELKKNASNIDDSMQGSENLTQL